MQRYILIDGKKIKQPDLFNPNWATTYDESSGRPMTGKADIDPMFTVESYHFEVSDLKPEEAKELLQKIIPTRKKPNFQLTYFSWYYGEWRTDTFYTGQGSMETLTLKDNYEKMERISFDVIGVNPL